MRHPIYQKFQVAHGNRTRPDVEDLEQRGGQGTRDEGQVTGDEHETQNSKPETVPFKLGTLNLFLVALLTTLYVVPANAQTWMNLSGGAKISINPGTGVTLEGNLYNDSASVIRNAGIIGHTDIIKNYGTIELSDTGSVITVDSILELHAGKVLLNGNSLIIYNKDTFAIQRTGGYLIAENPNWGKVIWHVGDAENATYIVPFFTDSLEDVSVALKVLVKGDSLGALEFSTYATDATEEPNNEPKPPIMQYIFEGTADIDSNWTKIADRYWKIDAKDYSNNPVSNITLKYSNADFEGANNITEDSIIVSRLMGCCWFEMDATVQAGQNKLVLDSVSHYSVMAAHDNDVDWTESFCLTVPGPNAVGHREAGPLNSTCPQFLKIYVHVIRRSNLTGGQSVSDVNIALSYLEKAFSPHGIYFVWDGVIDYFDSDDHFGKLVYPDIFSRLPHTDGIDIYMNSDYPNGQGVVNQSIPATALYIGGSWALPRNSPSYTTPFAKTHAISHEMGHCLGLWHTFPDGTCRDYVDGTDCDDCGDFLCDTPADPGTNWNVDPITCNWLGSGLDGHGDPYNPDMDNFMAYSHPECWERFTPGQVARMHGMIANEPILQATVVCPTTTISSNTTWTSDTLFFCDDLTIEDGATLELVDTRLEFARFNNNGQPVNLIIEPGGKLEMTNSTLTNLVGCGEMWHGVIVQADPGAAPADYTQNGVITTVTTGTGRNEISNAEIGINARSPSWGLFKAGGILKLKGVDFINNRTSIFLRGSFSNSTCINSDFYWNDDCLFTPQGNKHVEIQGAGQMPFILSDFQNLHSTSTGKGRGIFAVLSRDITVYNCEFNDLEYGIGVLASIGINGIVGSQFEDNDYGIFAYGADNLHVQDNEFTIPDATLNDMAGIHIENSTGIAIKDNRFTGDASSPCGAGPCSYGIVVDNSGSAGGRIFRNDFFGTNFGVQTEGRNPELSLRCNNFELEPQGGTNEVHPDYAWASLAKETELVELCFMHPSGQWVCDEVIVPWGELRDQGNILCNSDHQYAAGNRWMTNDESDPANINCYSRDKDIYIEPIVLFEYYHHREDVDLELKVKPECASDWWWDIFDLRKECLTDEDEESCNESTIAFRLAPPDSSQNAEEYIDTVLDLKSEYFILWEQYKDESDSLKGLLDKGNTSDLLDSVSNQSYSVLKKDTILRRNSPLSDEVMIAVMLAEIYTAGELKTSYSDHLRDLLVLNAPFCKKTIQVLHLPVVAIGAARKDSVMYVHANGPHDALRTAYIDSLRTWQYYDSELKMIDNGLRAVYAYLDRLDTTGASNEYETFLRADSTLISKKLLVELLIAKDSLSEAEGVLDMVALLSTREDSLETYWFTEYMDLMIELGDSIQYMDSAQHAQMEAIAESGAHVAPKAHAVLYMVDTTEYEYPIEKIDISSSSKRGFEKEETQESGAQGDLMFKIYPNPNDGKWMLEYELEVEKGEFKLFDLTGKYIETIELYKEVHKVEIEKQDLSSGIYLFKINSNNRTIYNGKIVIMRQ